RSPGRFGDRRRIIEIVFVALEIRLNELRRQNPDLVAGRGKHSTPVLRPRARFGGHDAPGLSRGELRELRPVQLLPDNGRAATVHADQMEPILPEIDADDHWLRHVPLLLNSRMPFPRGGADHSITPIWQCYHSGPRSSMADKRRNRDDPSAVA